LNLLDSLLYANNPQFSLVILKASLVGSVTDLPKCMECGATLPLIDSHALYRDGKRICQHCALSAQAKSPRFLPIPVVPLAIPTQRPSYANAMSTVGSVVSLIGLAIVLFTVFRYMPQYTMWAVVGASALLALYHPWWKGGTPRSKCDGVFMGAGFGTTGWATVKKDSWRPLWFCESCGHAAIEQTKTGQMLPCRDCGHENESFGPNVWRGKCADSPHHVTINDDLMRKRLSG